MAPVRGFVGWPANFGIRNKIGSGVPYMLHSCVKPHDSKCQDRSNYEHNAKAGIEWLDCPARSASDPIEMIVSQGDYSKASSQVRGYVVWMYRTWNTLRKCFSLSRTLTSSLSKIPTLKNTPWFVQCSFHAPRKTVHFMHRGKRTQWIVHGRNYKLHRALECIYTHWGREIYGRHIV